MASNVAKITDYRRNKSVKRRSSNVVNPGRIKPYAEALLSAIHNQLGAVDFFTREDLLQLTVFDHISTISRYTSVCLSVRYLINRGDVIELGRTELTIKAKQRHYVNRKYSEVPIHVQFRPTVIHVVEGLAGSFTVMDVVNRWETDPHLTTNAKRVIVRRNLKTFNREGLTKMVGLLHYTRNT